MELKTGYEWCLDDKIRLANPHQWGETHYFETKIYYSEFLEQIQLCDVIENSMPRKTEKYLEYRMYGLVPYNLSPIQQGIQFGHAVVEYGRYFNSIEENNIYDIWADKWKTFIILNGGTTNKNISNGVPNGTLDKHLLSLSNAEINVVSFYEPDLNDALTAIVFLVDERVFNKELYPSFVGDPYTWPAHKEPSEKQFKVWEEKNNKNYDAWKFKIGGDKNVFLREFLIKFKLA